MNVFVFINGVSYDADIYTVVADNEDEVIEMMKKQLGDSYEIYGLYEVNTMKKDIEYLTSICG
jgi:hypothetical protein